MAPSEYVSCKSYGVLRARAFQYSVEISSEGFVTVHDEGQMKG